MKVNEIIENLKRFENEDEDVVKTTHSFNEDAVLGLPEYISETIHYLEEELYTNPSYFKHILLCLARENFKWFPIHGKVDIHYEIQTTKGRIILM